MEQGDKRVSWVRLEVADPCEAVGFVEKGTGERGKRSTGGRKERMKKLEEGLEETKELEEKLLQGNWGRGGEWSHKLRGNSSAGDFERKCTI